MARFSTDETMPALDPPPPVQLEAPAEQDVIEVVANRSDQAQKIDRRTYRVRQTPNSAQKNTLQLLRGLPAVTITPDDQITLLGAAGVTVLIDGHASRTDLRTLHGSDIDRIEVITNPSAQYSAQGTGGIINIVLRHGGKDGLSGNASLETTSLGAARFDSTIKFRRGKVAFELAPNVGTGPWQRSTFHGIRSIEKFPGGAPTRNRSDGETTFRGTDAGAGLKATYEPDKRTTLTVSAYGGSGSYSSHSRSNLVGLTPDFVSFYQDQHEENVASFGALNVSLDRKGRRDGETLSLNSNLFGNPRTREATDVALSDGSGFLSERRGGTLFWYNKIDWQRPFGKSQILSIGAEWNYGTLHSRYRFQTFGNGLQADLSDEFRGRQSQISAYATFQRKLGSWTLMPGLRLEAIDRKVTSPGQPDVTVRKQDLFPTFHLERPIGKAMTFTASYSRRIDRPILDQLRPYAVQRDPLAVDFGNPDLLDQATNAYEINLHYARKKIDVGLILYDRDTSNVIGSAYSVDALGRNVSTPTNVGNRRDRGAQFDLTTPIARRIKTSLSINLFDRRAPFDLTSAQIDERFRFTSNLTLEYGGPEKAGVPGDVVQLIWHYESPEISYQFRTSDWNTLTLSYSHNLRRNLALTFTAESGTLDYRTRLEAPLVQSETRLIKRPIFKLKLMRTFGKQ